MSGFAGLKPTKLWLILGVIAATPISVTATVRAPDSARQMIHDPNTGLAIFGYDPVAFHSESRAVAGKPTLAAEAVGLVWRFASAANRAAFLAEPEAYLPLFGGHDGKGVGENRLVRGDPAIFLVAGGRAVFFRLAEDRDMFAADASLRKAALENWPKVAAQFAGH
jgi:hypothetical protein